MTDQPTKTDTQKTDGDDGAARSAAPLAPSILEPAPKEMGTSSGASLADLRARVESMNAPTVETSPTPLSVEQTEKKEIASPIFSSDIPKEVQEELIALTASVSEKVTPDSTVPTLEYTPANNTQSTSVSSKPPEAPPALQTPQETPQETIQTITPAPVPGTINKPWVGSVQGKERTYITGKPVSSAVPIPTNIQAPLPAQKKETNSTALANPSQPKIPAPPAPSTHTEGIEKTANTPTENSAILHKRITRSPLVQAIRTFRTDAMQVVDKNKISVVGAIAAEEERRILEKQEQARANPVSSKISPGAFYLLGIATTLIILGGLTFIGVQYLHKKTAPSTEVTLPSIIFTEDQKTLSTTGLRKSEIMDMLVIEKNKADITLGAITGIYLTTGNQATQGNGDRLLTAEEFLTALDTRAPNAFMRALAPRFTLGIHEFSKNEPFLIFTVTDYDNAYAGILTWESFLNADLAPLFGPAFAEFYRSPSALLYRDAIKAAATTSTSTGDVRSNPESASTTMPIVLPTTATTSDALRKKGFEDARFRNKEVRVLRNDAGEIVLLYSFLSRDTLVITTNEFTLKEVLTRLTSKRF